MPHHCIVKGCTNRSSKPECKDLSFYSLPHSNPMLLREWLVKMKVTQTRISEHSRLCSVHFVGGKKTQKNNTPCVFPWTHGRKPPMLRPNPPSAVKRTFRTLTERRAAVNHDHTYNHSSAATCNSPIPSGSPFLSVATSTHVKLYTDASSNTTTIVQEREVDYKSFCLEQIARDKKLIHLHWL